MCLGQETTQEINNASDQGAIQQRELTFEAVCKMFPCFCFPLFSMGVMKKKDDKYVYTKRTHSIIHHLVGLQYSVSQTNVFSYPLTTNGHLRLHSGSGHRFCVHVFRNIPPTHGLGSLILVLFPSWSALLFLYLQALMSLNAKHAGQYPKFRCVATTNICYTWNYRMLLFPA